MLRYNSPINGKIELSDLTIEEVAPIIKINLRGKKKRFYKKNWKDIINNSSYRI